MRTDVTLHPLDEALLPGLLRAAVEDADPDEVMPPVAGPAGWTPERRTAFLRFHRSRSLAAEPVEATFAIVVGETVVGAARLCPVEGAKRAVEAGVWIGRSHRGGGVGGVVLRLLMDRARADGREALFVSTKPDNAAVHRLLAGLGTDLVPDGETVTAWVDLTGDE
ncbi:GNAT family protein [Streptomyces sp. NPDC003038]|uniref:GNAT family protein n=1 Tax=unclassified Streptomyces TaxID=2593676 RepID=UPI0033A0990D